MDQFKVAAVEYCDNRMIDRFLIREIHIEQVREYMQMALTIDVTDAVVVDFLQRHLELLAMITAYDEVETEARALIWEGCRSDFLPGEQK